MVSIVTTFIPFRCSNLFFFLKFLQGRKIVRKQIHLREKHTIAV